MNSRDMKHCFWIVVGLLCFVILFSGCRSSAAPARLPVKMVWAGLQGGGASPMPSARWIDGPEALDRLNVQGHPAQIAVARAGMDWSHYGLVWIGMGQQRTGGYGLRLASSEAFVRKRVVVVSVQWRQPPKGAFVTQMITSPSMMLKLPRGDYRTIVIEDRAGARRATVNLPPAP